MKVDSRLCTYCGCAIIRRANERPNEYARRVFCGVKCLGQAKAAKRLERFMAKIDKRAPDECWPWTGYRKATGYGEFSTSEKRYLAHRLALRFSGVDVQPGAVVMHSCDNPPCCNPAHLSVGTAADNNRDMVAKGRNRHVCSTAKLTPEQRNVIISRRGEPLPKLAAEFGVAKSTICRVQRASLCA